MTLPLNWSVMGPLRIALVVAGAILLACCGSSAERAQSYYDNGVKLLAKHENQKAAIEFKNAIDLKRDMVPAWRGLAQIEEANHHWDALVPILQTIVQLDPHDVKTKLKLGRLLLAGGATDRALALVNGADPEAGADADFTALTAAIFYKLKDSDRALREAQAALALEPGNVDAIMVIAAIRLDSGDAKGALQILDSAPRCTRERPWHPDLQAQGVRAARRHVANRSDAAKIADAASWASRISQTADQVLHRSTPA